MFLSIPKVIKFEPLAVVWESGPKGRSVRAEASEP